MGLLDLDKIIIKRTVLGIRCPVCGGNLVVSSKKCFIGRLARIISLGKLKPECYECETCKKRYTLF
ncbi:hypothetical protein SAMN04487996_10148 [Dyadobacter soli]|uniref:Uncharacterized protein n=1 Tax=Dyadobacter soli TaxID=659014 RepID=A0A1G6USC1_9BACT|nr:hypothetical protein SAMN04487996_10148 [Dyadobacter soli]